MKILISALLVFILVQSTIIFAQKPSRTAPKITSPVSKFDPDKTDESKPEDSANDFAASGLPAPEDFGGAPNDALAAALAKRLTDYDEDNLPLLITTLQRAGFFIINENQKVLYQPTTGSGMGIAFYDFEVAGMLKLSRRGFVSSVEQLSTQIGKDTPEIPPSQVASLMMRDLRTSANSSNKLVRFWARLIVELGKNSQQSVDLLSTNSATVPLSVIQTSLWERRLIGDVIAFAQNASAKNRFDQKRDDRLNLVKANYFSPPPCQTNDIESLVMDASSLGITTAHGQFLEKIAETLSTKGSETLGKIGFRLGLVNIALSWAKLVAAMMTLKGEMKIEDPMPLERTKNSVEGQSREMTARVWAEVGNLQFLNCVRLALNTASGLDFSMPSDGPLAGRDIAWELTDDASFSGQGSSKTGKFDNFVNLKAPEGAKRNPLEQITDDNGESKMNLVGAPKIPAVINKPVVPVRKKAGIKIAVAFKSSRDTAQNFIDIGGAALGIATGGPIAILGIIPELGFRMKWDIRKLTVPVKDWELCTEDWAGTIEYKRTFSQSTVVKTVSRKGTRTVNELTEITWNLNPRRRDMPFDTPPIPADVTVRVKNSDIFEGTGEADVCCSDQASKDSGARIREAITLNVDKSGKSPIKVDLSDNFLLSLSPDLSNYELFKGTKRRSFTVSESACPVDEDQTAESTTEEFANMIITPLSRTKTMRRLLKTGESVEEIWGTESFDDPLGGKIVYKWTISRCGDL
ncbi:MAG: hypothetical protein KIS76_18315 [Pyrinomonadaceae bacterium]|nr:hypothetical protein [Pyrinomonadaceae bacterium]